MSETVWLFTYKNATGKEKYMAIYEDQKEKALTSFIANREPTDRLIGEARMTTAEYRTWLKNL